MLIQVELLDFVQILDEYQPKQQQTNRLLYRFGVLYRHSISSIANSMLFFLQEFHKFQLFFPVEIFQLNKKRSIHTILIFSSLSFLQSF
jgi:hypothetical protein